MDIFAALDWFKQSCLSFCAARSRYMTFHSCLEHLIVIREKVLWTWLTEEKSDNPEHVDQVGFPCVLEILPPTSHWCILCPTCQIHVCHSEGSHQQLQVSVGELLMGNQTTCQCMQWQTPIASCSPIAAWTFVPALVFLSAARSGIQKCCPVSAHPTSC